MQLELKCCLAGGGMVSRFVEVFRDLGSFSEVLQTQLELLLCERLTQTWAKVGCRFHCAASRQRTYHWLIHAAFACFPTSLANAAVYIFCCCLWHQHVIPKPAAFQTSNFVCQQASLLPLRLPCPTKAILQQCVLSCSQQRA